MIQPGRPAPALSVPLLSGGTWTLAERAPRAFGIVVFYRGQHCPICKTHLASVEAAMDEAEALGAEIVAVSMDTEERARETAAEAGLARLPVGYGLGEDAARAWGLYMSSARPGTAEPARFSEPGVMVTRPDGTLFQAQVQSAPFTRPDIGQLLAGLRFALENGYPARGDLTAAA